LEIQVLGAGSYKHWGFGASLLRHRRRPMPNGSCVGRAVGRLMGAPVLGSVWEAARAERDGCCGGGGGER
jgi:hypothetical protein